MRKLTAVWKKRRRRWRRGKAETQALARAAGEAKQRLVRAEERLAALKRDRVHAALPADHAARGVTLEDALAAAEKKAQAAEAARAKAETEAASAEKEERALFDPMRKAEARAGEIAAEVRALEKLTAQAAAQKFPPALNAIKVKPGYERAVAAALGDDVNAALDPKAPLRWAGAGATAKISWPDGAEPLFALRRCPERTRRAVEAVRDRGARAGTGSGRAIETRHAAGFARG